MLRDLGSSNGTFVNGKRVLGQQTLKAGDVLTIGGVTLRVDPIKPPTEPDAEPAPAVQAHRHRRARRPPRRPRTTSNWKEFELAIDDEPEHIDIIPLDDEPHPPHRRRLPSRRPRRRPLQPRPSKNQSASEDTKVAEPAQPPRARPKRKTRWPSSSWT